VNEDEMMRRLEALERKLNAERPAGVTGPGLRAVVIYGCLPPGVPLWATAGDGEHEWIRDEGEELDAFCDKVMAHARQLEDVSLVVFGGLPTSEAQHTVAMAAYDAWSASPEGNAPPPVEARR
jgi:hypothetical protein